MAVAEPGPELEPISDYFSLHDPDGSIRGAIPDSAAARAVMQQLDSDVYASTIPRTVHCIAHLELDRAGKETDEAAGHLIMTPRELLGLLTDACQITATYVLRQTGVTRD